MRKKIITFFILMILLPAVIFTTAMAADSNVPKLTEEEKAAEILWKLGLFHAVGYDDEGTPDFALKFFTTRIHGLIVFISFIGEEDIALSSNFDSPYDDVMIELRPYVEYAFEKNYLQGVCITKYDPDSMITAQHFLTTALGILGYENGKDFEWYKSWTLSDEIKLTNGTYNKNNYKLTRGEMAVLLLRMLGTKLNGSDMTLLDRLIKDGVFDENAKKGLIMDDDLLEAIKNGDKDKIRDAINDIVDGDKTNDDNKSDDRNNTDKPNNPGNNNPGNSNPGNNNPGGNNPGGSNPGGSNPGDNNKPKDCDCDKQDNKECEKCKDSDNKKGCDCEKHECEKPVCDHECEKPICDHDCEKHKCEHKCEDHECCKHECQDCKNHECEDNSDKENCDCPVCPNCEDKRICDDADCSDPDCDQHGDKGKDCDNPEGCDDPECPDCNHIKPCDNPECPFCKEPEDDCDSPDGCGDPDCENCAKTDCDSENGCDDPNCPNCKDNDECADPDCSDPDCDKHGNKGNDCDSEDGCDDPDCPNCNEPIIPDTWPKSFLNVTDEGRDTTHSSTAEWTKVRNSSQLPEGHTDAIKTTSCYMFQQTRRVYEFDTVNLYKTLSFTAYNTTAYNARIQVFDYDTEYLLWSYMLDAGESIYVENINISNTINIEFTAELVNAPTSATHYENAIIICDPLVDREPEPDNSYPDIEGAFSLLAITDTGVKTTSGNISRWLKVINKEEMPAGSYSEAIKTDSMFMRQATRTVYTLDRDDFYTTLNFTAYNQSPYTARLQIFDYETKQELWSETLTTGTSVNVIGVDISKATQIEVSAQLTNSPTATTHYYNAIYICNPLVFAESGINENDCDTEDGCDDPNCPNCNDDTNECNNPDGCGDSDCDKCKDDDNCESENGCGDPNCPNCNPDDKKCKDCDMDLCTVCDKCINCGDCDDNHCDNCDGTAYCDFCDKCKGCEDCEHCLDCGGEQCDFCGKCIDCENCAHCLDCGGELCNDCNECKQCNRTPCYKCCRHIWGDWYDIGDRTGRSCEKCGFTDSHGHDLIIDSAHLFFGQTRAINSRPPEEGWGYGYFTLPESHPLYGVNAWEGVESTYRESYSVHIDMYYCRLCWKQVFDLESAEKHTFGDKWHDYNCRSTYLRDGTYDEFIELMNRATEQWGNPDFCNTWSHETYDTCINCGDNNYIVIGGCSVYSCTGCHFGAWNYLYTHQIEVTDWYEETEDNISMCRSDIICKKPEDAGFCNTMLFTKTKPHSFIENTCDDCGYTVNDEDCNDTECENPECPNHGNTNYDRCFFCNGTETCEICKSCSVCGDCRHCIVCNKRVWHNFEYFDDDLGYHWTIVPELIGDGSWEDINEWLADDRNFIDCFGEKCDSCSNRQGTKITPIIKNWHEKVYSNGFSVCFRGILCSECNDYAWGEAKVHNFNGDKCIDCGAWKNGEEIIITHSFTDPAFLADVRRLVNKETGDIYLSDVSHITEYKGAVGSIKDYAGIEHFESLRVFHPSAGYNRGVVERLDVTQNFNLVDLTLQVQSLSSIDVSNNIKLEKLVLNGNNLTNIDISNNPKLTTLNLSYNNLTSIDLSNNPLLQSLDLDSNNLKSLDVSKNLQLTRIACNFNPLGFIDITSNTKLTRFSAQMCNLTELDVSKNLDLYYLFIPDNRIVEFDVSKNLKLQELIFSGMTHEPSVLREIDVTKNTLLETLSIGDTLLTEIDVSKCTRLRRLTVRSSNLSSIDLSHNLLLYDIDVQSNNLTQLDLSNHKSITRLWVRNNRFTSTDDILLHPDASFPSNFLYNPQKS